jgi:magnesium-protoporphyrin O-methyltransferase
MASCCDPRGCDGFFSEGFARRVAKRYRKRGLGRTERRMVEFLAAEGIDGASVLEVGGGVGELHVELLKRGAHRAVNLELSPHYDEEARRLLAEAGLEDRVERRLHDIAVEPAAVEPADVVVLHRVVCCYPDYERLLGAAAGHARRLLVFSYPTRNVVSRAVVGLQNLGFRLTGREFRAFAHPPAAMLGVLREQGLDVRVAGAGRVWKVAGLAR